MPNVVLFCNPLFHSDLRFGDAKRPAARSHAERGNEGAQDGFGKLFGTEKLLLLVKFQCEASAENVRNYNLDRHPPWIHSSKLEAVLTARVSRPLESDHYLQTTSGRHSR